MNWLADERVRAYIYRIGTPIGALLVFYGFLSEQELALWLGVVGAVLMIGEGALASAHTSTKHLGDE